MADKNRGVALNPTTEERQTVAFMAAAGIPQERIAPVIRGGINLETLKKWFNDELEQGRDRITTAAIGQLARAVTRGEAWAICFWLKCRAGFQERQVVQVEGEVNIVGILRERFAKNQGALPARERRER